MQIRADRFDRRRGSTYDHPSGVDQLNPILDNCQHLYNHRRPTEPLPE
jgi:hypothetical protein